MRFEEPWLVGIVAYSALCDQLLNDSDIERSLKTMQFPRIVLELKLYDCVVYEIAHVGAL